MSCSWEPLNRPLTLWPTRSTSTSWFSVRCLGLWSTPFPWRGGRERTGNGLRAGSRAERPPLLSTGGLGAFIFIDDYFNCLTVGTVMKPVTDSYKISRAKLAYIIDATAAPICIIAPISSWAARGGKQPQDNRGVLQRFCRVCFHYPL